MTGFAPRARARVALLLVVVTLTLAGPALAQEDDESSGFWRGLWNTTPAGSLSDEQETGLWSQTGRGIKAVWGSGQSDLFIPGYILHQRYKYTDDQRHRYNTVAWGFGYGRTLKSEINRPRTVYGIVSADSYSKPQYMVGYAWRARWRPGGGAFSLGGGWTGMLIGREDKLHYAPLPLAVPLGSIGVDRFELMCAYVPGFEVGYFFLRVNVGRSGKPSVPGGN